MGAPATDRVHVRNTEPRDFAQIGELCRRVYPNEKPWMPEQLASHRRMFPEAQFVALDREADRVVGMSASLIVRWECYDDFDNWEDFTADGMFTNHDRPAARCRGGGASRSDAPEPRYRWQLHAAAAC
jgi:hypothetical protein